MQPRWSVKWARALWLRDHPEGDRADAETQKPWDVEYKVYIESNQPIPTSTIRVAVVFRKGRKPLLVHLSLSKPVDVDADTDIDTDTFRQRTTEEIQEVLQVRQPEEIITLEFYTSPEFSSPWAAFGPSPQISSSLIEEDGLKKLFFWVTQCVLGHKNCQECSWYFDSLRWDRGWTHRLGRLLWKKSANDILHAGLPVRLVRIIWKRLPDQPKLVLVETAKLRERIRYTAVSHVWAYTTPHRVTQATYKSYQRKIPWSEMSLSLRQAIFLSKGLGLEYLWIDSLCIIQDSTSDKQGELPRMSLIYENADIVLAIHGPNLGLERANTKPLHDPFHLDNAPVHVRVKIDHQNLFRVPQETSSWFGRAWCMQERIFASRIIHFGGAYEEAFFECNTEVHCECGQLEDDIGGTEEKHTLKEDVIEALRRAEAIDPHLIPTTVKNALWNTYVLACEDYTARGITFSKDTLLAVSSLMNRFSPYLGEYYGGLWQHRLLLSLQWETSDTLRSHRHDTYVAPSFSWASRSGAVVWYFDAEDCFAPETHHFARLVDVSCRKVNGEIDPCGIVSDGSITLEGRVIEMRVKEGKLMLMPDGRIELVREGLKSCWVTLDSKDDYEELFFGQAVKCLEVMRDLKGLHANFVSALIILPIKDDPFRYRRIGFSTMLEEHFLGSKSEIVIIV